MKPVTRRSFLQAMALSAGTAGMLGGAACASDQSGKQSVSATSSTSEGDSSAAGNGFIMSFVVMSDTHITDVQTRNIGNMRRALADIKTLDPAPVRIVIVGDITDLAKAEDYELVRALCDEAGIDYDAEVVNVMGNHDQATENFDPSLAGVDEQYVLFMEQAGVSRVYYDMFVEGQHFICLGPDENLSGNPARFGFSDDQMEWLDALLDEDRAVGRMSFVFCHEPIGDTVRGTTAGMWGANNSLEDNDEIRAVLHGRPNVVYFSGHIHLFPEIVHPSEDGPLFVNDCAVGPGQISPEHTRYPDDFTGSFGWCVSVFGDRIEFKARNFLEEAWVDGLDYVYPQTTV